jgi:hypothetical protein
MVIVGVIMVIVDVIMVIVDVIDVIMVIMLILFKQRNVSDDSRSLDGLGG